MNSIRRQLTRQLLTLTLVLLGAGLTALYYAARDAATDQFEATLRAKALAISTLTRLTPEGVRLDFTDRFLRGFERDKGGDFFLLRDSSEDPVARSESLDQKDDLPFRRGTFDHPAKWNLTLPDGHHGRAIAFAFKPKPTYAISRDETPEFRLVVASNREELDESLWQLLGFAAGWAGLFVVATLWAIPRVLRHGLASVDRLAEQTQQIHADSLSTRFTVDALPIELRPIATRLNDLLARLEQSFERERRFSADLAHELRTPLAELRAQTEYALKWPDAREAATDQETLAIVQQMEAMVGHLLALARGEQGLLAVAQAPIALGELVREVWKPYAKKAAVNHLVVAMDVADVTIVGDPTLVRGILNNLFDNAVEYASSGVGLAITLVEDRGAARLTVANGAPELASEDVPKLFDRFWRKEAARSGGKHVGLGLSLARSFAMAMGWSLTAAFDSERRIAFTLTSALRPGL
jgi:signal transduction histidine kinase